MNSTSPKRDMRYKFSNVNVMLIDQDSHSSSLVHQLLMSFGFRKIKHVTEVSDAIKQLRANRTDLIITEWLNDPAGGVALVKSIRSAKNDKFISPGIPIIMLTAKSAERFVKQARDAGVTEFLAKPFSAKTVSNRLIDIINHPREFIETSTFQGPSRRRKEGPPPGTEERRLPRAERQRIDGIHSVIVTRANTALRDLLDGENVLDILTEEVIHEAQTELMKAEGDFFNWVKEDIDQLEKAYSQLAKNHDPEARAALIHAAYTIKSQSGIFGYDMGTIVADMLVNYLNEYQITTEHNLIVIRKHIDTIDVIIAHKVKHAHSPVGLALIDSLNKLVTKFG